MLEMAPFCDPFKLAIFDWKMPRHKGTEAIDRIASSDSILIKPRVMIMSGYWNDELHKDIENHKVERFLPKPFRVSTLLDMVVREFSDEAMATVQGVKDWEKGEIPTLQHAHLLLAEDNELNQEVALGLLEETGCKVTVVENGKAALKAASNGIFDLILMDIQMPEMDGYETTKCIRELEEAGKLKARRGEHLPIIAMTAGTLSRDKHRAFEAGMDDHVAKPVDPDHFYSVLAKWIPRPSPEELEKASMEEKDTPITEKQPEKETSLFDSYGPFPGIDIDKGLGFVRGKEENLLKVMRKFITEQTSAADDIRAALSDSDQETAHRLAHTLKGHAGLLGAARLQEDAKELEFALKEEGGGDSAALIEKMEKSLQEVLGGLAQLESEQETAGEENPVPASVSKEEAIPQLDRLMGLLNDGDSEAIPVFEELAKSGIVPGSKKELTRLRALIESYSFDEASEVLDNLVYEQKSD